MRPPDRSALPRPWHGRTLLLALLVVASLTASVPSTWTPVAAASSGSAAVTSAVTLGDVGGQRRYGTLQSSPDRLPAVRAAGVDLVTVEVAWARFEPARGQVDAGYVAELQTALGRYRAAGVDVVLATGVQYSPAWLLAEPGSRYVNQYGAAYSPSDVGKRVVNMVFVQRMRDAQQAYLARLFATLGTDFYGVRLGGGWYGELNYPDATYAGRSNAYWGFDPVATGASPGLPAGVRANPVPGWVPGTPSTDHRSAALFADWYLSSLQNYHDWQITTVRALYPGRLLMLYPSWGVRPGQLAAAVQGDLAGTTSPEVNGEVQRGFDVARYVRGISDPGVVVYTTWLNAGSGGDAQADQRWWSPVKYLAYLAAQGRTVPLAVMGENTGRDSLADMTLTFAQARAHHLQAVVWAFEPDLFSAGYASVDDLGRAISTDRATNPTPTPTASPTPTPTPTASPTPTPTPTASPTPTATSTATPTPTPTPTSGLVTVSPTTVLDTTTGTGTGGSTSPVKAGGSVLATVAGTAGVPADAEAVSVLVTTSAATSSGWVTVAPAGVLAVGSPQVPVSPRATRSTLVVVPVGDRGQVVLTSTVRTHLAVSVVGYLPARAASSPLPGATVLDTRTVTSAGPLPAGASRTFAVRAAGGAPVDATAVVMTLTASGARGGGTVALSPGGGRTGRAVLPFRAGETRTTTVLARIAGDGRAIVSTTGSAVHVSVEVRGWLRGSAAAVGPFRVLSPRAEARWGRPR